MNFLTDPFLIPTETFSGPVLVTGAGGCIGSWACAILKRSGVSVIATDLQPNPMRASLIMGEKAARDLNMVSLDVTDAAAVEALVTANNVQAIIHLAGLQVPFCAANPSLGARVNVEGTINILQAARNAEVRRTVFASSVAAHAFLLAGSTRKRCTGHIKSPMKILLTSTGRTGRCHQFVCDRMWFTG